MPEQTRQKEDQGALRTVARNPWVRVGALVAALALVALVACMLSAVLLPLFFAFIVAYMFDPVADAMERKRIPRTAAVVLIVVALLVAVLALPVLVLPGVVHEAEQLVAAAASADFKDAWLDSMLNTEWMRGLVRELGWVEEDAEDFNARAVLTGRIGNLIKQRASQFMQTHAGDVASVGQRAGATAATLFASLGTGLLNIVVFLGNLVLFAFVAVYLLRDYDRIVAAADDLIPPRHRPKVRDIMHRIDLQLRAFLRGQAMVCAFLAFAYGLGMWLSGTPFAVPLALLGGLVSFIPYLGPIVTIGPAVLLTVLEHGIAWNLAGVIATFALAQALEGNFITPKIVGTQVGLGPVWVILAIMVFSSAFGFFGLLLAVPIAAVLKVLVGEALDRYRQSRLYQTGSPGD